MKKTKYYIRKFRKIDFGYKTMNPQLLMWSLNFVGDFIDSNWLLILVAKGAAMLKTMGLLFKKWKPRIYGRR